MAKVKVTTPQTAKQIAKQYGTNAASIRELNKLDKGETISGTVRLGKGVGPVTPSRTAESLYVDPTPMYQPAMDFINKQMGQANTRYATNQADIKTIFGNLTTVREADKAKIKKQFEDSIASQQMSLAQRTAEARSGSAAGAQQLAVTAGERGQGPMPASTPVQQAAEEGIARSNEYQQTWQALQNVMSQQAQNDVQSAITGYNYQQASALEQLRNNLEQRLSGLEGQQVDVQSQLAGAQLQGRQGVMQANYGEIQARRAQEAALREAQARAAGTAEAARIRAEADANKPTEYSDDVLGWELKVADAGGNAAAIRQRISQIVAKYRAANDEMPTREIINQRYQREFGDQGDTAYANELVRLIY